MTKFKWQMIFISAAVLILSSISGATNLPGSNDDTGKTVVYRDTWGVPHIYAPTMEAGMYAMGWAQAEDRPEELLKNFLQLRILSTDEKLLPGRMIVRSSIPGSIQRKHRISLSGIKVITGFLMKPLWGSFPEAF